jgi:hypothetical protein
MSPEAAAQLTREEFERVLNSERFATIHDLVRAPGFRDLTDGSQRSPQPVEGSGSTDLPALPTRR